MDEVDHLSFINQLKVKYPPIVVEEAPEPSLNYDEYGERLMILKIENENFKSYGGIQTLGPFHQNFTCIIGPNGSGKSNVIDSLLFVFGFRASKIRSKKISVLIHKSEMFQNVQSCSVRVFFQKIKPFGSGEKDYEVIPNSEFIVSRTAYKDNSSAYQINGNRANNKEVSHFLKKQGIDLDHNRFLILQGEVEQIALMKPKAATEYEDGLLEYLEDIIGSHRFKEPLQLLFTRLEELCDLRTEKLNRVKIVGKEKKELEGIRNEAVKYLRLCNEIVVRKNIFYQLQKRNFQGLQDAAIEKEKETKAELDKVAAEINEINAARTQKEAELKEIVQQHLIKMGLSESKEEKFKKLEIEDINLRDERKHLKVKIDNITKDIKLKEKDLVKYENVPGESVLRIEQLSVEITKLEQLRQTENENLERAQKSLKEDTKDLVSEKDKKSTELLKIQEVINSQNAEISSKQCQLDILIGNYEKEKKSLSQLVTRKMTNEQKISETKQQIEKLKTEAPILSQQYDGAITKLKKLQKEESLLVEEIDKLRHKLNTGRSKHTEHQVISFLMEQQNKGTVSGVIGRLGSLGSVDPKYDIAISTACGRLDNIITDTMDGAQRCVELMKIHNKSRSTFVAMDKIQSWGSWADREFKAIDNALRAFDLIYVNDKKFRTPFYFVLRDLLIVKEIEDAVRINSGGKKSRIVTLKGEITEPQGAMVGGGSHNTKGKICTDPSQIQQISRESSDNFDPREVEQTLKQKQQRLIEVRREINNMSSEIDRLKMEQFNADKMEKACHNNLNYINKELNEILKEIESGNQKLQSKKPDEAKVKIIQMDIDKLSKILDKDIVIVNKITEEVDAISERISSIGLSQLGTIESRLESTQSKIKEKSQILKKINLSVKNAEKICKQTSEDLDKLKGNKEEYQQQFAKVDVTLKELEKLAEETLQEFQQVKVEVQELQKSKDEMQAAQSKINEEFQKSKQIHHQIKRNYEEKKQKVDEFRTRVRQMQDEINKLTLYPMPEGVDDEEDDNSFMDLIGEPGTADGNIIYSSQPNCHSGTELKIYSEQELSELSANKISIQEIEDKLQKQKPNLAAIEEYRKKEELYLQRASELNEVTQLRDEQQDLLEKLKRQRHQEFTAGFNLITKRLKEMYQMITMGGDAELELVDSLDPFSEGILFSVRPPKKSWKNISNLSGGEKTLSSLALVFALHHFKPTPFYVMDEIDAALDFKNVSIVANYLKKRTKNAQFIVISLRNYMYELADCLVNIQKPFNFTKVTTIHPQKLAHLLRSSGMNNPPSLSQITIVNNVPVSENEDQVMDIDL